MNKHELQDRRKVRYLLGKQQLSESMFIYFNQMGALSRDKLSWMLVTTGFGFGLMANNHQLLLNKYRSWITSGLITPTPYMVLPLFATRFAACAGGIRVSFIQPRFFNLKWNVLHDRDIIVTYMDEIHKHAFRVCAIWDAHAFQLMNYCGFNIEPFCSDLCGGHRRPQTLAEICRNMGICCGFRAVAARENIRGSCY